MRGVRGFISGFAMAFTVVIGLFPGISRADSFTAINSQPPNWK